KILKDIGIQCGFKVRLTYHVARHCALSLSLKLNGLQRLAS
ncbi:MAG TPA: recombinase, partial [Bacteroides sp.]|nr:recombinase [Bacteroides sp.]